MIEERAGEEDPELTAPGFRWGTGAQSVLPYLTKTLQARPAAPSEPRDTHAPEATAQRASERPSA